MAGVMILNPSPRRKRKSSGRRRRKMTAKQLKFFGPRRKRKARTTTRRKTRSRAKPKVIVVASNPTRSRSMSKKRKRRGARRRTRRAFNRNPIRRRRFRRNPIEGAASSFMSDSFVPAAIGAAGAVGTDIVLAYLPVPMNMRAGMSGALVRILASLGVGYLVGAMSNRRAGAEAAAGGIVVTLYQILRPWTANTLRVRMARYVPMAGMGNRARAVTTPPNMRGRMRLAAGPRGGMMRRRMRRGVSGMGAYANPARIGGGMTPALMRYIASNGPRR